METEHPVVGTFRTVRSPVSYDGQRPLEVRRRRCWASTTRRSAGWKLREPSQVKRPHQAVIRASSTSMTVTAAASSGTGAAVALAAIARPRTGPGAAGQPLRIGSTLALTGPLSATALIHKLVGEIYVEQLNKRGGLLGRRVEWIVKDDQSKPDLARTLYEQLVTADKVDLLMGPYATGAILSAMGVAQRYNKVLVHHTFGIPSLAKYDMQFPAWSLGPDPAEHGAEHVFDVLAAAKKPPKTIAMVTSKFPSVHFMSLGAREVAKKRGLKEVLFLEWDFGNRDFGPIAARVKDANPDFVWIGASAWRATCCSRR